MKKKTWMLAALAVIALLFTGCSVQKQSSDSKTKESTASSKIAPKNTWETAQKSKTITIGLDDTFVPMGFRDKSGEIVGYDIDLAKAVFAEYGITPKFQPIDWSMKETELKNGTIDLIWNGYSKTPAREKDVLFSNDYMKNKQVVVTLKDKNINNDQEMKDKIIGAQNGSSGYDAFNNQPKKLKDLVKDKDAVLYDTFDEAFLDLKAGRIDGLLIDRVYANYYLSHEDDLSKYTIFDSGFKSEDFAVGMRKQDKELDTKINDAFKKLKEDGKMKEISQKWFGEDVTAD